MNKVIKNISVWAVLMVLQYSLFAQDAAAEATPSFWSQMELLDKFLLLIAIGLLIPIFYLSKIFNWSLKHYLKQRIERSMLKSIAWMALFFLPAISIAQQTATPSVFDNFNYIRWFLLFVILMEVFVLGFFGFMLYKQFAAIEGETCTDTAVAKESKLMAWWKKMNNFGSKEDEARIDTGHNYDGIRELDNNIPAWFTATFVITMLFAVVYLWRYHVAQISPLMEEEYQIAVADAEMAHQQYLKTAGSGIDENSLELSSDKGDLDEGKKLYLANCASCHVADGGGQAGPNLTDNSWIYGCMPKDIYQSIKYGRKNGMMAWKDNFNDKQIVQLASFVKSLQGTKPASPKAAQGDACDMNAATAADTSVQAVAIVPTDSTKK